VNKRIKLGAASRAAVQFGMTRTSRDIGTTPLTAPASGVGRLSRLIGLCARAGEAAASASTTTDMSKTSRRMTRIQPRIVGHFVDAAAAPLAISYGVSEVPRYSQVVTELWTEDPRLAAVYDAECIGRRDHDFYVALAHTIGAGSVVDIGCGTGVLAVDLAGRGCRVIGVDPSATMLDVARRRPGGSGVEWIHGYAADVPSAEADLAVMTGHVAQYFIDDRIWADLLRDVHRILVEGGRLAFETRNPAVNWAQQWTRERTTATFPHPDGGEFAAWVEMSEVAGPPESYTSVHVGHTVLPDGARVACSERLRFRSAAEILASLDLAGFAVETTWGDWDNSPVTPDSDELIVLARRE